VRLLGAGAVAAGACAVIFYPRPASAWESLLDVVNAENPNLFQHTKQYTVNPDGSRRLQSEIYTARGQCRMIDYLFGDQSVQVNGDYTTLLPSGEADVFHNRRQTFKTMSLKHLLYQGGTAKSVSLDTNARLHGRRVHRYLVGGSFIDGRGVRLTYSFILDVDPASSRPLRMLGQTEGCPRSELDWDYPAYSPSYFKLPITSRTHVVDKGDWGTYLRNLNKNPDPNPPTKPSKALFDGRAKPDGSARRTGP
jgi:hypothetical protein